MSSFDAFFQNDDITSSPLKDSKKMDIFQHLRLNLKNSKNFCSCDNINSMYCIPCKVSVCSKCNYEEHKSHILICKKEYNFNPQTIDSIYNSLLSTLFSDKMFLDHKPIMKDLINQIETFTQHLHTKIDKLKDMKIKEISKMFEGFSSNVKTLKQKIEKGRNDLKSFYNKNKKFFNTTPSQTNSKQSKTDIANNDPTNSLFLMNYELLNISQLKRKDIDENMKRIHRCLDAFKHNQNEYIDSLQNSVDSLLFGEYYARFQNKNQELECILDEASPSYTFKLAIESLNDNNFQDITARVDQYNVLFDQFKKSVYESIIKYGNMKEIEKYISTFESTKTNETDSQLFSQRNKDKVVPRQNKSELALLKMNYHNKDEVILNNELLMKYFSCLALENYEKNFKQSTKELQSSHADLMIKRNEEEDDKQKDFARAIENTNLILIYNKKQRRIEKRLVDLKTNPFGYKKFPNGCRSILIGDKVYITGGKDEIKTYQNVIIYDRKSGSLKRIIDLCDPRAYHTLVFCEIFETLMVIGGENCSSCEIFDPLTNRWTMLPLLNYPRANILFHFDKPRGMMYALFGNEGTILEERYSSEIEYLDLQEIRKGWIVMNYENRTDLNLKKFLYVEEINNDLMFIHGGGLLREHKKGIAVFDKEKERVVKFDRKMEEKIREELKAEKRINAVVSGLNMS